MSDKFELIRRTPGVAEYCRLRSAVGWPEIDPAAADEGLRNSLFSVCVMHGGEVVGCGRVVGDGGIYYYIQDIIVLPEFQKNGVSKMIMAAVMKYIEEHAGKNTFTGLMAAKGTAPLYAGYGFKNRPTDSPGMYRS